jgi:hypothetical protein
MKYQFFLAATGLVMVATVVSGVLQGRMRNRWGPSPDMVAAADRLAQVPDRFADWRLQSSEELDESTRNMLECAGYFARNYVNQATGEAVSVTVLLGPPGPIAVHTPEVCFASRNYQSRGKRERVAIRRSGAAGDEFWALDFKLNDLQGDTLRTYYAWSIGEHWLAPDDPRFQYAGSPYLYKIQLSSRLPTETNPEVGDPCRRFLHDFLPAANKCLTDPSPE